MIWGWTTKKRLEWDLNQWPPVGALQTKLSKPKMAVSLWIVHGRGLCNFKRVNNLTGNLLGKSLINFDLIVNRAGCEPKEPQAR